MSGDERAASAVTYDPALVGGELVELTRSLGDPAKDQVILAEGNTSQRPDDDRIVVKTSGSRMRDVSERDFVVADLPPLIDLLDAPDANQDDLTRALDAGEVDGRRRRGSIETLVHVAVQAVRRSMFIAHTHPTAVVGLMASVNAAAAFDRAAYSDEAVVIGRPLYVPYAQPGIDLGRLVYRTLRERMERSGEFPQLILLGNHGIVATSETAAGTESICEMAVKAARVRTAAYASGGLAPLSGASVDAFFARGDIAERQGNIARGQL